MNYEVLIADDNPENIKVLSGFLKTEGYRIRIAMNGEQALASSKEKCPDIILLDIQMPLLDGYEACKRIKAEVDSDVPIIFVSAMDDPYNKVEAFKAGGVDYITKPFYAEEILIRIKNHIHLNEYRQQLEASNMKLLRQFKTTFDQAAVGIVHIDTESGKFIKWNHKFEDMICQSIASLGEIGFNDILLEGYRDNESENVAKLKQGSFNNYISEFPIVCKDKAQIWLRVTVTMINEIEDDMDYMLAVVEDISKRVEAEVEVKQLNEDLEERVTVRTNELGKEKAFNDRLINSLPGIFHTFDKKGQIRRWNKAFIDLLGCTEEELLQSNIMDYFSGEDSVAVNKAISRVFEEGFGKVEARLIDKNQNEIPFLLTGSSLHTIEEDYLVGVGIDISERKRMEQDLIVAKEKAEVATKAKSDFLAMMSHEIRTPMNAIIGLSHLVAKTQMTPKQVDYINKINRAGQNLLGIINDVLDFSKIEAGKLDLESIHFNINDVLDNVINIIAMKAQEKELELIVDMDASVPKFLVGDPLRLGQVLLNLTNNAVKFTKEGSVIIKIEKKDRCG